MRPAAEENEVLPEDKTSCRGEGESNRELNFLKRGIRFYQTIGKTGVERKGMTEDYTRCGIEKNVA
jgi:hypothetical protein